MKARLFLFILFINISSFSNKIESSWADKEIIIDGDNSEWLQNEIIVLPGTFVSVSHDEQFIYFSLRTNNEPLAHKFSLLGLTIWINHDGKRKKENGLLFPIRQKNPRGIMKNLKQENGNKPSSCEIIENSANRAGVYYSNEDIKFMPLTFLSQHSLKSAVGCENSLFTYELKIPRKNYDNDILPFKIGEKDQEIRICFESGSLDMNDIKGINKSSTNATMARPTKGGGGRPGGGKGRAGGGGMKKAGGNMNSNSGNMNSKFMNPVSFWIKVNIDN